MKSIITFLSALILLLQFAALPCSARTGRRSSPPALENIPELSSFGSLNGSLLGGLPDPDLKILSRVPYDEKMGRLTLRITALKRGRFVSSYNLLPCMVDMLSTAFDAIWNEVEQHPKLHNNEFTCSENGLTLTVLSKEAPMKEMEYGDLVYLAKMLLNFQQVYMLPGITFHYVEDGQVTGTGEIAWNQAASSIQSLEQA